MLKFLFLVIFGHSLFTGDPMLVSPYQEPPVDYILSRGDSVLIDIYGASQMQISAPINNQGKIIIPSYGPVEISGMTLAQAQDKLRRSLSGRFASCQFDITLFKPREISVTIKGEVENPGIYLLSGYSTLLHAIQKAHGFSREGNLRDIQVMRGGKQLCKVDLYDYLIEDKDVCSFILQDGDVVVVPTYEKMIDIEGLVKRPMIYQLRAGQTIADLIALANGISTSKEDNQDEIEIRISHPSSESSQAEQITLEAAGTYIPETGDSITVIKRAYREDEVVYVGGNVKNEGSYRIGTMVRTVDDVLRLASPLSSKTKNSIVLYRGNSAQIIDDKKNLVEGRDALFVCSSTVHTDGEGISHVEIDHVPGKGADYYIEVAGGFHKGANKKHIIVIGPNGLTQKKDAAILPGSTIVIDKK